MGIFIVRMCKTLTLVFMQITESLLICEDDGLVLCDDLSAQILPTGRQFA